MDLNKLDSIKQSLMSFIGPEYSFKNFLSAKYQEKTKEKQTYMYSLSDMENKAGCKLNQLLSKCYFHIQGLVDKNQLVQADLHEIRISKSLLTLKRYLKQLQKHKHKWAVFPAYHKNSKNDKYIISDIQLAITGCFTLAEVNLFNKFGLQKMAKKANLRQSNGEIGIRIQIQQMQFLLDQQSDMVKRWNGIRVASFITDTTKQYQKNEQEFKIFDENSYMIQRQHEIDVKNMKIQNVIIVQKPYDPIVLKRKRSGNEWKKDEVKDQIGAIVCLIKVEALIELYKIYQVWLFYKNMNKPESQYGFYNKQEHYIAPLPLEPKLLKSLRTQNYPSIMQFRTQKQFLEKFCQNYSTYCQCKRMLQKLWLKFNSNKGMDKFMSMLKAIERSQIYSNKWGRKLIVVALIECNLQQRISFIKKIKYEIPDIIQKYGNQNEIHTILRYINSDQEEKNIVKALSSKFKSLSTIKSAKPFLELIITQFSKYNIQILTQQMEDQYIKELIQNKNKLFRSRLLGQKLNDLKLSKLWPLQNKIMLKQVKKWRYEDQYLLKQNITRKIGKQIGIARKADKNNPKKCF